jgi:aryl-alcohol dehydrogenase-like predicted oxidoreductase
MDYVRLGRTGLSVSRLCLGCMSYGSPGWPPHPWVMGRQEAQPFFRLAAERGINFFDTADHYSFGVGEEILGEALRTYFRASDVAVAHQGRVEDGRRSE